MPVLFHSRAGTLDRRAHFVESDAEKEKNPVKGVFDVPFSEGDIEPTVKIREALASFLKENHGLIKPIARLEQTNLVDDILASMLCAIGSLIIAGHSQKSKFCSIKQLTA